MIQHRFSRRDMLLYSSAVASLHRVSPPSAMAGSLPHEHSASVTVNRAHRLEFFTTEEAADIESLAEMIIPADDTPGARDAGVVHFIDSALVTFEQVNQDIYRKGLKQLRGAMQAVSSNANRLAEFTADEQLKVLKRIEHSQFFETVRTHTIMGFFGNTEYGGNRDNVGWKLIGFEDKFSFQAPFGYYDAQTAQSLVQPDHEAEI